MYKKIIALFMMFSLNTNALEINNNEPYTVVKGDTLWDISEHFLKDPWEWKSIWKLNPEIENPDLIYPGDVIKLVYIDGKPQIIIEKTKVVKSLSLNDGIKVKTTSLSDSIPAVNIDLIEEFDKKLYISNTNIKSKIIASYTDKIIHFKGEKVIVSLDKTQKIGDVLSVLEFNSKLKGLNHNIYDIIGKIKITEAHGDLFVAEILSSSKDISSGDLIYKRSEFDTSKKIFPSKPDKDVEGKVIFNHDRINAYKNKIVIINKGYNQNIGIGNILSVDTNSKNVKVDNEVFLVKGINKGYIFIYKLEENFSYGIIVKNKELIKVGDNISSPF